MRYKCLTGYKFIVLFITFDRIKLFRRDLMSFGSCDTFSVSILHWDPSLHSPVIYINSKHIISLTLVKQRASIAKQASITNGTETDRQNVLACTGRRRPVRGLRRREGSGVVDAVGDGAERERGEGDIHRLQRAVGELGAGRRVRVLRALGRGQTARVALAARGTVGRRSAGWRGHAGTTRAGCACR